MSIDAYNFTNFTVMIITCTYKLYLWIKSVEINWKSIVLERSLKDFFWIYKHM